MDTQRKEKGDFCFLANMNAFLETFGMKRQEFWLGGITGVMGFYFTTLKSGIPSMIHGRSESFEKLYEHFATYFNNSLTTERFTNQKEAFNRIKELLQQGIIPMMWMDEYYLPEAYCYEKNHLWVMAVIKKDLGDSLLIYNNEEMLLSKNSSENLVTKEGMIEIQYQADKRLDWKYSEKELIRKGLEQIVENLYKSSALKDQYFGIQGMKKYKEVFANTNDYQLIYQYFFEMNRGGGIFKTRRNMKLFLKEIKATEGFQLYEDLENKWMKITNLTFKLSVTEDKALQKRIVKRIEEVIRLEEQGAILINELKGDQYGSDYKGGKLIQTV